MKALAAAFLAGLAVGSVPSGDKDRLREALGDRDLAGSWIYDDLDGGFAESARTGKPLMVVLRCVT